MPYKLTHAMKTSLPSLLLWGAISLLGTQQTTFAAETHYRSLSSNNVVTFSDSPLLNGQLTHTSYAPTAKTPQPSNPCKGLTPQQLHAKGQALNTLFSRVAAQFSLNPALLKAVARTESCFHPLAVSRTGALGLMQLMPDTAKAMGVTEPHNLQQNLTGGARYLSSMLKRYAGDTHKALAAYNAGPTAVDTHNGVPPFAETKRYIVTIERFQQRYAEHFGTQKPAL